MRRILICASTWPVLCAPVFGQTVTVTTTEDSVDIAPTATFAALPGPDGQVSFREALIVTNSMPGPQTIEFAIPVADWWLFEDYAALKLESGIFFVSGDDTTIDFASQALFTGDTNPNGREVGIYGLQPNGWGHPAIAILASGCVVKGLGPVLQRSAAVSIDGGTGNRVIGCVTSAIQLDPQPGSTRFNVIGGTLPEEANVLDAVEIFCGADDNLVIGNRLKTARVVGSPYCATGIQQPTRNRIGGTMLAERNVFSGAGSYGSEGFPVGQNIEVLWARDTHIQGNYIGVTPDGLQRVPQVGPYGISIADSVDTEVRDNLIAGMRVVGVNHYAGQLFGRGIRITAINTDTDGVSIEGNLIGTDASGLLPIQTLGGIEVSKATILRAVRGVRIGGCEPGQANTIAFTEQVGVSVLGSSVEAELRCNSIHSNGLLGIDLGSNFGGADGVTANDPLDVDDGGNGLQNYPAIQSVTRTDDGLRVRGTLDSSPDTQFATEFFGSTECDDSGFGEGQEFLGGATLTSDAAGHVEYDILLGVSLADGASVAATATHIGVGATSEFGECELALWTDAGHALAGANGSPELFGSGSLGAGSLNRLELTNAASLSLTGLFFSTSGNPVSFFGGQLVPFPVLIGPVIVPTDAAGALQFEFSLPPQWVSGTELWFQFAVLDPGANGGLALSNALQGLTP